MIKKDTEEMQLVALSHTVTRKFKELVEVTEGEEAGLIKAVFTDPVLRMNVYKIGLTTGECDFYEEITIIPQALTVDVGLSLFGIEPALVGAFEEYYTDGYKERLDSYLNQAQEEA